VTTGRRPTPTVSQVTIDTEIETIGRIFGSVVPVPATGVQESREGGVVWLKQLVAEDSSSAAVRGPKPKRQRRAAPSGYVAEQHLPVYPLHPSRDPSQSTSSRAVSASARRQPAVVDPIVVHSSVGEASSSSSANLAQADQTQYASDDSSWQSDATGCTAVGSNHLSEDDDDNEILNVSSDAREPFAETMMQEDVYYSD
jgi:hypothetical protein